MLMKNYFYKSCYNLINFFNPVFKMNKTPLHRSHIGLGAKMVNFSNWEMPISYSSLIEEHNAVRSSVGIFDVSHMAVFDFDGGDQIAFFEKIFANDIKKISKDNKAI